MEIVAALFVEAIDFRQVEGPATRIDITGAEVFGSIRRLLESQGVRFHMSGLKLPAQQVLERAGLLAPGPMLFSYRTDGEALAALSNACMTQDSSENLNPSPARADS